MAYNPDLSHISQRTHNGLIPQRYDSRQDQQGYQYQGVDSNYRNANNPQGLNISHQDFNGVDRANGYPPQILSHLESPRGLLSQQGRSGQTAIQRPATADGMRGRTGQYGPPAKGRGYSNSGSAGISGMRFPPIERSETADPTRTRKPLRSPLISPDQPAWDSPFPTFPGTQKKSAYTKEQEILEQMTQMEIGATPKVQSRAMGRRDSKDMVSKSRGGSKSEVNQHSNISSVHPHANGVEIRKKPDPRNLHRDVPEQIYYDSRQGNSKQNINAAPQNHIPVERSPMIPAAEEPGSRNFPGYKSAGRGLPPRPSTAAGNRPPPQRNSPPMGPPADFNMHTGSHTQNNLIRNRSLGDLYDNYYEPENQQGALSSTLEMPDFNNDSTNTHRRGSSFDAHMQVPSFNSMAGVEEIKPLRLKQNMNEQSRPLFNEYQEEWNAPPVQNGYYLGYADEPGAILQGQSYNGSHTSNAAQPLLSPKNLQPPPPHLTGMNNLSMDIGVGPKSDVAAYSQMHVDESYGPASDDALPLNPLPVRPGLGATPGSHVNKKPTPIRNYNGIGSSQQSLPNASIDASKAAIDLAAELEYLRQCIKTNPGDQVSPFQLAKQLVDAGDSLVQSIPDQRARNKAREKHIMEAHRILKKLVSQQNVDAMFFLADCYGRGAPGLEVDHKEAFSLYQSAAKVGHAAAAYRTAVCCELGNEEGGGTRKDPLKAIQWYKRAAMLGDTPAMYKMGIVLLKGLLGQPRNPREAIGWLKRAAERADAENPHALHELALLYEQPQGTENSVIRDEAYSFQLFQQAADLGYKYSQFRLGCAYEYGLFNCPISPKQSILWYSRAAAQEEHQSELALSGWYLTGSEGVLQQSDTEAYLWARKAAIAGLAKAEYAMGYFTEVGIGSPGNLDDAKRWYWRAAAQNFPKARERLEDLKRGGNKAVLRPRDKISR